MELGNIDGKSNTLAYASLGMNWNDSSTVMTYTMKVDTSDFPIGSYATMSAEDKANLAGVIAHEMTHLIMYDTVTDGMLSSSGKTDIGLRCGMLTGLFLHIRQCRHGRKITTHLQNKGITPVCKNHPYWVSILQAQLPVIAREMPLTLRL